MRLASIRSHEIARSPAPAWVMVAALATLAAAVVLWRRRPRPEGIESLRDEWHGEGPEPVDERVAAAS